MMNRAILLLGGLLLGGCAVSPPAEGPAHVAPATTDRTRVSDPRRQEILLYSLGLLDVGYRFGGKNPEAGLDCSGMVAWIYRQAAGMALPHNAAAIARQARPVSRASARPGDLVFFNTLGRPFSHMGIYLGEGRFIHAPSSGGSVRQDHLDDRYWTRHLQDLRRVLPD